MLDALVAFLGRSRRLVVLTGAGCSTESGIPDYRSPGGAWTRHKPIYFSAFTGSEEVRRYYWARSYRGWPRFAAARPNDAHRAIAALGTNVITQNVDDLHAEAGSGNVVQLHGRNRLVLCLGCGEETPRLDMQQRLAELNADWLRDAPWRHLDADEADFAPDGDAAVAREAIGGFRIPPCERCGGVLKPAVVFFGESVPKERVERSMRMVDDADALLVVGSSLTVWSGFRFVKRASERGLPIAIVNVGPTRGDDLATLKIESKCGPLLSAAIDAVRSARLPA